MLIRIGCDIVLRLFNASPIIFLLRVHPSRQRRLVFPERFQVEPDLPVDFYFDSFGNLCGRLNGAAGRIRFRNHAVVWDGEIERASNPTRGAQPEAVSLQ